MSLYAAENWKTEIGRNSYPAFSVIPQSLFTNISRSRTESQN